MKFSTEGTIITATFDGLDPVMFDAAAVNPAIAQSAQILGLSNKLRDSAAIAREQKVNGRTIVVTVTDTMRREKVAAMAEALAKPDATWELRAKSAPTFRPDVQAYAEKHGMTYKNAEAYLVDFALSQFMAGASGDEYPDDHPDDIPPFNA